MAKKPAKPEEIGCMMDPNELIPYENNPRLNEQAIDQLMVNIQEFGFTDPIVVDEQLVILAGHTRREASIRLGMKQVPVIIRGDLTGSKGKAFRLAHNKAGEIAGWDFDKLDKELEDLMDDYDMSIFGFDIASEIDMLFSEDESEWEEVEPTADQSQDGGTVSVVVYVDSMDEAKALHARLLDEGYDTAIESE